MQTITTIDSNALAWGVFHALPPLTHKQHGTAVIYGFLQRLLDMQSKFSPDLVALIWDSVESKRIDLFPEYKLKRRTKQKELTTAEERLHKDRKRQFRLLHEEILPELGFANVLVEAGLEGDDIIASIAHSYKDDYVCIVGRDGDLYQLITDNCTMYDPISRNTFNREYIINKYGIQPEQWATVKGYCGCTTDEVPGIQGVGEGFAIKYLKGTLGHTSKAYKKIVSETETIEFTKKLVVLPFAGTPTYELQPNNCSVKALKRVAKEYGLNSLLTRKALHEWRRYFCEEKKTTVRNTPTTERRKLAKSAPSVFDRQRLRMGLLK